MVKRYGKFLRNEQWLHKTFLDEELSCREIGVIVGCDATTVRTALKTIGIKLRSRADVKKGEKNPNFGKHPSIKTREKQSGAHIKLTHIQRKLNCVMKKRVRRVLHGAKGGKHWGALVGYTVTDLMSTLERDFRDGMSWDNYGKVWHIDHIIPLVRFHYDSPEDLEFKKAWSLGNLQPLLATENLKKGTKFRFY